MPSTREVIPEANRPGFNFRLPIDVNLGIATLSYAEWEKYHYDLGQELAKRIRREA